jgi:hypothetical protein
MSETWLPVLDTDGLYEVSDHGRVRSWRNNKWGRAAEPKILNHWSATKNQHQKIFLSVDGVRTPLWVHRLVMAAFVGPCPDGEQVRHLDGDATNNHLDNLAYGTQSDNELDKVRHGKHRNASKTHCIHGHEFTPENTLPQCATRPGRTCRTCAKRRQKEITATAEYRAKRAAYMREYNQRKRAVA